MISPGYSYAAVDSKEIFMTRDDIRAKFRAAEAMFRKYKFNTSPIYLEFLQGKREMTCTAWANPTRNIKGWKGPCYLITDTHHDIVRRPLEQDPLGEVRLRQGPALRELHGARRATRRRPPLGVNGRLGDTLQDDQVAVHLIERSVPDAVERSRTRGDSARTMTVAVAPAPVPADVGIVAALPIEVGYPDRPADEGPQVLRPPRRRSSRASCAGKIVAVVDRRDGPRRGPRVRPSSCSTATGPRWLISAGFAGALESRPDPQRPGHARAR